MAAERPPPSALGAEAFVDRFGDIAEHSPQLAGAVFNAGVTPAEDTPEGLAAAFSRAILALPQAEKIAFLNLHPDLAGKLNAAERLTEDSAREQGGAGLAALGDDERARFLALNAAYRKRFGFPFIVAVAGLNKADILAAFEARLQNPPEAELAEALRQIDRIILLRLRGRLG